MTFERVKPGTLELHTRYVEDEIIGQEFPVVKREPIVERVDFQFGPMRDDDGSYYTYTVDTPPDV